MKKTLILIIIAFIGVVAFGQNIFKYNVTIERTTPTIFLKGSGGIIDFNSNDVRLTLSSNLLTLSGGNLSLGSNSITSGSWQGSAVTDSYISSAATWNAKQTAYTNLTTFGLLANAAGVLTNNGSGVFSYSAVLANPMTTAGDIIYGGTGGAVTRLALGTQNYVMTAGASAPQWTAATTASTVGTNLVTLTNPSAVTWLRVNADNTVTALTTDEAKVALGITSITPMVKTASYEIDYTTGDAGKYFVMNVASANTLTLPLNATDAFPVGTTGTISCIGAGQTTIVLTSGITGISPGSKLAITVHGTAGYWKYATDTWVIYGNLE